MQEAHKGTTMKTTRIQNLIVAAIANAFMAVLVACNSTPPPQTQIQTEVQVSQVPIPKTAAEVPVRHPAPP
jgi:ABC-type uncharacterized transport system auxiliary subunit